MTQFRIRFTKEAKKDVDQLTLKLKEKLRKILVNRISNFPYEGKKLVGDLQGFYSVRLTHKDRIVYSIDEDNRCVFIHRARSHYNE